PSPVILGINRTQDASVTLMEGDRILCSIQKERLTRQKHHWGKLGDLRDVYVPRLAGLDRTIDVLVECFSSDREMAHLGEYEREIDETLRLAPDCKRVRISHHLAHLYSVFHPSPFEEAAVMVVDGQGSPAHQMTETWPGAEDTPPHWREVSSFYAADRKHNVCLDKQRGDCDAGAMVGLGMFYFLLTQAVFPGEGNEGKVMGLAPYGDPAALGLPPLDVDGANVTIPAAWTDILRERERFRYGGAEQAAGAAGNAG